MNPTKALVDTLDGLDIGISAWMIFNDDWQSLVTPTNFLALVYIVGGDEQDDEAEPRFRVDLYGYGVIETLDKAQELVERLCYDPFGSSCHFVPEGMIDDIEVAIWPAPVPSDLDQVALVSTTYTVTARRTYR